VILYVQSSWLLTVLHRILLACLKFLSRYPCPRCLVEKSKISALGTARDRKERTQKERVDDKKNQIQIKRVRKWIYEKGKSLMSVHIDRLLGHQSLIPTRVSTDCEWLCLLTIFIQSAFSIRLSSSDFNFYQMFVPDLLHEFELGVWKGTFTHLMRILYANGGDLIQTLNERSVFIVMAHHSVILTLCQIPTSTNFWA
jgi:hypothetical protein